MSERRFTGAMLACVMLALALSTWIFLTNSKIDVAVAAYFYAPESGFVFNEYKAAYYLRKLVIYLYGFWYLLITTFAIFTFLHARSGLEETAINRFFPFSFKQWFYLVATSIAGPLLITNVLLKNNWGRARPREIQEFGGSLEFTPALHISDQCQTNCSFVSGEPSSMFMIFLSLAFILPAKRKLMLLLALIFGALSGLMRIGQGGHFLSDVVFAGLLMALIAALLYWVMFLVPEKTKSA